MTRYQLAKLVQWAETLRTRKKLQKVVFMLQAAGCPFAAEFNLHLFGPYSAEVAERADEMTGLGLLREERVGNLGRQQYNYTLTDQAEAQLVGREATPEGAASLAELAPFAERARELLESEVRELEIGATIVYFRRQGHDWTEAVRRTCAFKRITPNEAVAGRAETLARSILA